MNQFHQTKHYITVFVCLFAHITCFSQAPGGESLNLSLWLDANTGTYENTSGNTAENNDRISVWADRSGNNNHAINYNGTDRPRVRMSDSYKVNYLNNTIDFDGINDQLDGGSGHYTDDMYIVFIPKNNINRSSGGTYIFNGDRAGLTYGTYLYVGSGNASTTNEVFGQGVGNSNDWQRAFTSTTFTFEAGVPYILQSRHNAANTDTDLFINGAYASNGGFGSFRSADNEEYRIGNLYRDASAYSSFYTSEIINYSSNNSNTKQSKIESYLAIKYGITLYQFGSGQDYLASDGSTIFPASSTHSAYNNDIAGIGRDDNSGLAQTKSKSVNNNTILTMTKSSFATDRNFVVWGNNGVSPALKQTTNKPLLVDERMQKVWRVYETGDNLIDEISIDISSSTLNTSNLALLIDDDGDFTNASIHTTGVSYSGGVVTFEDVNFDNVTGSYITVGSSLTALPVKLSHFDVTKNNESVEVNWGTIWEINTKEFVIERSYDLNHWEEIHTAKASGTTNEKNEYVYLDTDLNNSGTVYYRLVEYDIDGYTETFTVESVNFDDRATKLTALYHNHQIIIKSNTVISHDWSTQLSDVTGNTLRTDNITVRDYEMVIDHVAKKGLYIIKVIDDTNTAHSLKVMVQ